MPNPLTAPNCSSEILHRVLKRYTPAQIKVSNSLVERDSVFFHICFRGFTKLALPKHDTFISKCFASFTDLLKRFKKCESFRGVNVSGHPISQALPGKPQKFVSQISDLMRPNRRRKSLNCYVIN